ncbi:dihydrofolate reductase family protein [Microbacterium sp. 1P10AE]|jgi:dihydrofolate reductase|uniref:dihydrofolate reductase family protein n=1 Tax=Microbacterium sp. 1P10AE TaxID=3132286 RepID=UPI0039A2661C
MRELVYYVAASIDGFIADARGRFDAFLVEGDHSSVLFDEYADALPVHARDALGIRRPLTKFDTVIMGWNTLRPALDAGIPSPYPHLRQIVASRQNRSHDPRITLTSDPGGEVERLKREPGLDIWLCGGGELAGTLLPRIDRLVIKRNPIVVGVGIPLFSGRGDGIRAFERVSLRPFDSGVVVEEWVAAAAP